MVLCEPQLLDVPFFVLEILHLHPPHGVVPLDLDDALTEVFGLHHGGNLLLAESLIRIKAAAGIGEARVELVRGE